MSLFCPCVICPLYPFHHLTSPAPSTVHLTHSCLLLESLYPASGLIWNVKDRCNASYLLWHPCGPTKTHISLLCPMVEIQSDPLGCLTLVLLFPIFFSHYLARLWDWSAAYLPKQTSNQGMKCLNPFLEGTACSLSVIATLNGSLSAWTWTPLKAEGLMTTLFLHRVYRGDEIMVCGNKAGFASFW